MKEFPTGVVDFSLLHVVVVCLLFADEVLFSANRIYITEFYLQRFRNNLYPKELVNMLTTLCLLH